MYVKKDVENLKKIFFAILKKPIQNSEKFRWKKTWRNLSFQIV